MKLIVKFTPFLLILFVFTSCVSNKKYNELQSQYNQCETDKSGLINEVDKAELTIKNKEEMIQSLRDQLEDAKKQRDKQSIQVGDLTVLTQAANENIKLTLAQLEKKDKYINLLQSAKSKTDSMNLALALNLKGVLQDGIDDEDIEIEVDKTVVFVNLSDRMLFRSGSSRLTSKANDVLAKIAEIVKSRPDLEVMVEGYTDNVPMSTDCITDNWDLSVKRATSVVRALEKQHKVDPNKMIAAGRGENHPKNSNSTADDRAKNRRTRIVLLPKLNQFYDLLDPNKVPK